MNQMNIKAFLNLEQIPHYTIWYYISSTTGKKTPIGEKNNDSLDTVKNKRNINPTKPTSKYDYTKKCSVPFVEDEETSLQKTYSIFLKYDDDLFCVDIDDKEINSMEDFINKTGIREFENACWIKGNTKGIHIYVRIKNITIDDFKNQQGVFNDFEGDFIKKNNMWEITNKNINNYEDKILTYDFYDIKYLFNIEKMNFKRDNNNKIKFKTVDEGVDEGVEEEKIEMPMIKNKPIVDIPNVDKNQEVENILRCLKAERFTAYDSWLQIMFMVCNELGLEGKEMLLRHSKRSLNKEHENQNKNETMYMEYFYKQKKLKKEEKIKIGSGHMWAKNDNLILYKELFQKIEDDDYFALEFEKTHAKIIEKGCYIKQRDNDVLIMSPKLLNDSYSHLIAEYTDKGQPINFIKKWTINNPRIRQYDNMDIFPDESKCPSNYFNLWMPFAFEKQIDNFIYNEKCEKTEFILNHIKILCNHQDEVYEYILKYIAQMIQYPAVKSIIPTFISKQGAGKGTLMKLLTRMLGSSKVIETSSPSRDVWGNFNSMMSDSFLVNLNELSRKETTEAEGKILTLITDPKLTINGKNMNQFQITSYHRFIITTNKEDPIKTTNDDRRNLIIRSSDEKIKDKKYFEKINEYLDDDIIIKNVYESFKRIENMNKFGLIPIPCTNYQDNLKEGNRSIIELWIESFVLSYSNEIMVKKENHELFRNFNEWKSDNNIQYEINNVKFGCNLSNINIDGITRDGKYKRIFNIPLLKKTLSL